jgi:hypothetical protein
VRALLLFFSIFASDVLFAQQVVYKTVLNTSASFDSVQNNSAISKERLLSPGKLRVYNNGYSVIGFTIIVDGAVVDLAERINEGDTLSPDAVRLINKNVRGDLINIDCIIGKNRQGNIILCKPFYLIIN